MHPKLKIIALILLGYLNACSSSAHKPSEILVEIDEPDRIRFSGKGAGAGMMLSSSMGPMGIAIGVAIDEGISKEIDKTASEGQVSISNILKRAFSRHGRGVRIHVKRYGFVLARGNFSEDHVKPELMLEITTATNKLTVSYPSDFQNTNDEAASLPAYPLDDIKVDSSLIKAAFEGAAVMIQRSHLHAL